MNSPLERMSDDQLAAESSAAIEKKDAGRVIAIENEKMRRRRAIGRKVAADRREALAVLSISALLWAGLTVIFQMPANNAAAPAIAVFSAWFASTELRTGIAHGGWGHIFIRESEPFGFWAALSVKLLPIAIAVMVLVR